MLSKRTSASNGGLNNGMERNTFIINRNHKKRL